MDWLVAAIMPPDVAPANELASAATIRGAVALTDADRGPRPHVAVSAPPTSATNAPAVVKATRRVFTNDLKG